MGLDSENNLCIDTIRLVFGQVYRDQQQVRGRSARKQFTVALDMFYLV